MYLYNPFYILNVLTNKIKTYCCWCSKPIRHPGKCPNAPKTTEKGTDYSKSNPEKWSKAVKNLY